MNNLSSIEVMEMFFMQDAYKMVYQDNPNIEDVDALCLAWKTLWTVDEIYSQALENGKDKNEALLITAEMFYKSAES